MADTRTLSFHGSGGTLFGIQVVNALLTLVTVGVYYFWAKVRTRTYLLSQTELGGDRFAYHGTGKELLVGALKAVLVFLLPVWLLNHVPAAAGAGPAVIGVASLLASGLLLVFFPVAIVGARRYRLSRTSWRGVRFSFRGETRRFVRLFVIGAVLSGLTLGLYYPVFAVRQHAFLVSRSWFGNRQFDFDGRAMGLFGPFLLMFVLTLPTLGLCWFWYYARKQRFLWDHTTFGAARFRSTVTAWRLFGLVTVNVLLVVLTLGLALPWVRVRSARFGCRYLALEGAVDLDAILQEAQAASATGEGLAGFLDTDLGLA